MPKKNIRPLAKSRPAKSSPAKSAKPTKLAKPGKAAKASKPIAKPIAAKAAPAKKRAAKPRAVAVAAPTVAPVARVIAADQQHLLLLFIPLINGKNMEALGAAIQAFGTQRTGTVSPLPEGTDPRPLTGVHFFMIHIMPAGSASLPMPIAGASVPMFQTAGDKDMLLVMSIYDGDFGPYIGAFFSLPPVVDGLNRLMFLMDESGLVEPTDPSSAISIRENGGVVENSDEFLTLLRRYNFADGQLPGALGPVNTPAKPKYFLGATFPGLTIGKLLSNYPKLDQLYPISGPAIKFDPATG